MAYSIIFPLAPKASAQPPSADEQQATNEWPNWVADNGSCVPSTPTPASTGTVDITNIVNKYHLQSAIIQQVGGSVIASSNANTPPATPASTMKLIVADTLLRNGIDLSKTVTVGSDVYYDSGNDIHGSPSQVTLGDALQAMLSYSSNVAANVLMKAMGGVTSFTQKAQGYGYTHTTVNGYYDPSNDGKNTSTISDEVAAMNHIFTSSGPGYQSAQASLKLAAQNDDHYDVAGVIANKWAGTTTVAGNVGMFSVNGNNYIVGLYYNGDDGSSDSINAIKNGSADLVDAITTGGSAPAPSGGCCSGGPSTPVSGSVSPDVGKGMSTKAQQTFQQYVVAAGNEFGVDPNFVATFYYTETGRTGDSSGNNSDAASGTPVTGDGNWIEPAPPVGTGNTYVKNDGGYWPPYGLGDGSDGSFNTMAAYGEDGDGDGKIQPNDLADAVFTAAHLLSSDGAKVGASQSKLKDVAYLYNHSDIYAQSVLNTYNYLTGKGSTSVTGTVGGGCSGSPSADCSGDSGTAKILCAAKAYQGIYYEYGGGHAGYSAFKSGCPDPSNPPNNQATGGPVNGDPAGLSGNPSPCGLDCSSLVSVAVDDAFGQDFMWLVAGSMQGAGADNWHSIPMSEAKGGDIVTSSGHVEIVDHVSGGTVYTFGAHDTGSKIGPDTFDTSYFTGGAWRWAGPGS